MLNIKVPGDGNRHGGPDRCEPRRRPGDESRRSRPVRPICEDPETADEEDRKCGAQPCPKGARRVAGMGKADPARRQSLARNKDLVSLGIGGQGREELAQPRKERNSSDHFLVRC
jgi:hypothetical protein